jgi:hypothetical protein
MLLSIANSRPRNMESVALEGLYPQSLRQNAQSLISFIERYYDHLNRSGFPSNEIANITRDKDIDIVSNKYLTEIQSLIARNIPNSRVLDKVTLYRIIIQYYRTRGSEDSIHTFFKIFFDEIVDIFYPRNYLFDLSGGSGAWAPINIPSLRKVYTNPNKNTLEITSDYKDIGPFPKSATGPYTLKLTAISKYVWTYGGREKSFNLPYVEKVNIAGDGEDPAYRWVYRYKDIFELYSTNDTVWPDEAEWNLLARNIDFVQIPDGVALLESGRISQLQNYELQQLEDSPEITVTRNNIEYSSYTLIPPTIEAEEIIDESSNANIITDESASTISTEKLIITGVGDDNPIIYGIQTQDGEYLTTEFGGSEETNGINIEESSKVSYTTETKNIEYVHIFTLEAIPEYTARVGDLLHSLEDSPDSKVYRSSDLDPILWDEIDKNSDVWTYTDNKSFASDLYKLHDGEYWQKYSYRIRSQLPQEEWVDDYLRFVHPTGLKLFTAILFEFISRTSWNEFIDYSVKKPQANYAWLSKYNPPQIGYHTPTSQPGWLSGNERLLTILLEYLKSPGSEDDFIRLITITLEVFSHSNNTRDKAIYDDYRSWLKYLDPNELIAGYSGVTFDRANADWSYSDRNLFSNISSFINFRIKDNSYYPWYYSELIAIDSAYEDTDPNYNEAYIESFELEDASNFTNSTLLEKEPLIYRYPFEREDDTGYLKTQDDDFIIAEGQSLMQQVIDAFPRVMTAKENQTVKFYILTKHIPDNAVLYFEMSDTNVSPQSGQCVVKNNIATFKVKALANFVSSGSSPLYATIRRISNNGPILAQTDPVTITNNSNIPTYSITASANSTIEGGGILFTVNTTNVPDYTSLYYSVSLPSDVSPSVGGIIIKDNTANFRLLAVPDLNNTEGNEYFNISLYSCGSGAIPVAQLNGIEIKDAYSLWNFGLKSSTLTGFSVSTVPSENIHIGWSDGTAYQTISSGAAANHTYTTI